MIAYALKPRAPWRPLVGKKDSPLDKAMRPIIGIDIGYSGTTKSCGLAVAHCSLPFRVQKRYREDDIRVGTLCLADLVHQLRQWRYRAPETWSYRSPPRPLQLRPRIVETRSHSAAVPFADAWGCRLRCELPGSRESDRVIAAAIGPARPRARQPHHRPRRQPVQIAVIERRVGRHHHHDRSIRRISS